MKGHAYPRKYYRCTVPHCLARKHTEISGGDEFQLVTTYVGIHIHPIPGAGDDGSKEGIDYSNRLPADGQARGIVSTRLQTARLAEADKQSRGNAEAANANPTTGHASDDCFAATGPAAAPAGMTAATAGVAAVGTAPQHIHHAPAGYTDFHQVHMLAAKACAPPLHTPPATTAIHPSSSDAQQAGGKSPLVSQPAVSTPILATPSRQQLAQDPVQASVLPMTSAPTGLQHDPVLGSAVAPPTTVSSSASSAMPESIVNVVDMVNHQMGPQQLRHHITQAQGAHLEEVFGDVEVLLDLVEMEDKPLNSLLRSDGKLNALQIVSMRRLLRTIMPKQLEGAL